MDVSLFTRPGAMGDLHYAIGAYTGIDRAISWFPLRWQLHLLAHKIERAILRQGVDRVKRRVTFSLPDGRTYLIVGAAGYPHAVPWPRNADT